MGAVEQSVRFASSEPIQRRLVNVCGWCFGGPEALCDGNPQQVPLSRFIAYTPFRHAMHQISTKAKSKTGILPKTTRDACYLLERCKAMQDVLQLPDARAYMARGTRLEVTVAAKSVEEAFNLALYKFRHLISQELMFLVVPHNHLLQSMRNAMKLMRAGGMLMTRHVSAPLEEHQVRLRPRVACTTLTRQHILLSCVTHPHVADSGRTPNPNHLLKPHVALHTATRAAHLSHAWAITPTWAPLCAPGPHVASRFASSSLTTRGATLLHLLHITHARLQSTCTCTWALCPRATRGF